MEHEIQPPPTPGLGDLLTDLTQQVTLLGLALGCALKATAHRDPERAQAIEDNLRLLMSAQDIESWQPRAQGLLDLLYTALQERASNGGKI